ncbi:MAG: peptidoglycan DD-metalloendopeptidase family protein [Tannerellaceae bacterium]|nr:peptidoglycan DD-metalloendopeptidase family protein [Tannerellaceae bacterium]
MNSVNKKYYPLIIIFICMVALGINTTCKQTKQPVSETAGIIEEEELFAGTYQYGIPIDSLYLTDYTIKNGENLSLIFSRLGFSAQQSNEIIQAAADVLPPTKIRAGMGYTTLCSNDSLSKVNYIAFARSKTDYAIIDLTTDTIRAYEYSKPVTLKRHYAEGVLNSSLWNTLKQSGADPLISLKLADVFAWQIDFFDVKEGDAFRLIYDVTYIDDTTAVNIASIQGAVFTHKGKDFVAIPFEQDSVAEYFDEEGNSLRKAFLKAPLDFYRITSRFSNSRFHPVLKRYRAHHGVDYAAPVGTPVKSIGDGTVIAKGYEKGGGNYVKVKHNSVYTTTYMHLSKFAQGLQVGSRVRQGDVIAYVGSTGLSTGPHLDFRVHKNGTPIDPLQMDAPPSEPVKPELQDSFALVRQLVLAEMDSYRLEQAGKLASTEALTEENEYVTD